MSDISRLAATGVEKKLDTLLLKSKKETIENICFAIFVVWVRIGMSFEICLQLCYYGRLLFSFASGIPIRTSHEYFPKSLHQKKCYDLLLVMKLYRGIIKQKTRPFYFKIHHKYCYIPSCRIYDEAIWRLTCPLT